MAFRTQTSHFDFCYVFWVNKCTSPFHTYDESNFGILVFSQIQEEHKGTSGMCFQFVFKPSNFPLPSGEHILPEWNCLIVSEDGVYVDPKNIEAINSWPKPKRFHEVISFLGLCSCYSKFVGNLLIDLTISLVEEEKYCICMDLFAKMFFLGT